MRPAEFTPEVIIQAGQELQAAGRSITGFSLRQHVGGGNPTRLREVWEAYVASQVAATVHTVEELPLEVVEKISAGIKGFTLSMTKLAMELNGDMVKAAERRVDEAKQEAEAKIKIEREAVLDAERACLVYESNLENKQQEADQLRSELATVRAMAETAEREAQRAAERIAKAEADQVRANKEASAAREEAAKLRGQLEATQAQAADLLRALKERQAEDGQTATKPGKGKKGE